jgi:hypothetical protein
MNGPEFRRVKFVSDLTDKFGSAKHPDRSVARTRPAGLDDATVQALGKLSEALEVVENARGHLYEFHRMSGMANLALQEAVSQLRAAGHDALAGDVDEVLVGRDVLPGLWTFQIVEAYDEQYFSVFLAAEEHARGALADGMRHLFEAEMKHDEQTRTRADE